MQRASSRRQIDASEVPFLEALGFRIAQLRVGVGLSQAALADEAELARTTVERIEAGTRRTRRSTLERIAEALELPGAGEELAALAGPALAPESPYGDRIERRRNRRSRRHLRRAELAELSEHWHRLQAEREALIRLAGTLR